MCEIKIEISMFYYRMAVELIEQITLIHIKVHGCFPSDIIQQLYNSQLTAPRYKHRIPNYNHNHNHNHSTRKPFSLEMPGDAPEMSSKTKEILTKVKKMIPPMLQSFHKGKPTLPYHSKTGVGF